MASEQRYPTDLTDAQWELVGPLVPPPKRGGRPRTVAMRFAFETVLLRYRVDTITGLLYAISRK